MNEGNADGEIGIRITPPNLAYSTNGFFRWLGTGILDKPISDFLSSSSDFAQIGVGSPVPYFIGGGRFGQISVFRYGVIPEPAEYALVFGLLALAFVVVRRRFLLSRGKNLRKALEWNSY